MKSIFVQRSSLGVVYSFSLFLTHLAKSSHILHRDVVSLRQSIWNMSSNLSHRELHQKKCHPGWRRFIRNLTQPALIWTFSCSLQNWFWMNLRFVIFYFGSSITRKLDNSRVWKFYDRPLIIVRSWHFERYPVSIQWNRNRRSAKL